MKRLLIFTMLVILLVGCSSTKDANSNESSTESEDHQNTDQQDASKDDIESEANGILTKVGQSLEDDGSKLTLLSIVDVHETTTIGPMELLIEDVKVIKLEPSEEAYEDYYYQYSDNPEALDYVQINLSATNESDEIVNFNPISTVVTSNGQQLEFPDNEMAWGAQQLFGDYYAGVTKEGHMAFALPKGMDEPFEWIKFYTSQVFDEDINIISDKAEITVEFE